MPSHDLDFARSLRSPEAIALRRLMLHDAHMEPLTAYVENLRNHHPKWEFPDFDPLDGGSNAEILFLLEKPGPMTSANGKGSGFISRNNNDRTAEATFGFMKEAGIPRKRSVLWNLIPGWNDDLKVTAQELRDGVDELKKLLPLLPHVRTVVFVGRKAERARKLVEPLGCRMFASAHPSRRVQNRLPEVWRKIPKIWAEAWASTQNSRLVP